MSERSAFVLVASYGPSIGKFRGRLIRTIMDSGIEVHVVAPDIMLADVSTPLVDNSDARLHQWCLGRVGTNPLKDLRSTIALLRIFIRTKPRVVLAYTLKPLVYGLIASRLAGVPRRYALVTGVGFAFTEHRGLLSWIAGGLCRLSLRSATKIFFQNPDDELLFRKKRLISSNAQTVIVAGSGVDLSEYEWRPPPAQGLVFLMIGRLLVDKGVREYAEAARLLKVEFPDYRFQLAGWMDDNPACIGTDEFEEILSHGAVEFLGKLDDVRSAISAASVYVLPSYREGTPRTVLEAMSIGRAIITTDAPGCRETVINEENGYLVPVASVEGLVLAMRRFIEDPRLVETMGARSRQIAEEKFDVKAVNANMLREMQLTSGEELAGGS